MAEEHKLSEVIMKKSTLVILLVMMFFLVGCVPHYYKYEDMKEKVEGIDIVFVVNKWEVIDGITMQTDFRIDFIKTLTVEEMDELLLALSKVKFRGPHFGPPHNMKDFCLKIYYDDFYEFLWALGSSTYTYTDKSINHYYRTCSEKEFSNLMSRLID